MHTFNCIIVNYLGYLYNKLNICMPKLRNKKLLSHSLM